MNKKDFIRAFDVAKELNSKCLFVEIIAVGTKEIIVIPQESFEEKRKFYENTYDDNLVHVMNHEVKIVGYSHGNLQDLANHIEGGEVE